jgi:hypothetical protein
MAFVETVSIATVVLLLFLSFLRAETKTHYDVWGPFKFFVGKWEGSGNGKPGLCKIQREYRIGSSFAVWHESNENPFAYLVTDVISRHIKRPPADPEVPTAFRFAQRGKLARILKEGANRIRERLLKFRIEAPISRDELRDLRSGPQVRCARSLIQCPPNSV